MWDCLCACGNTKKIYGGNLRSGRVKSCGCQQYKVGQDNPGWRGFGEISFDFWGDILRGAEQRNLPVTLDIEYIWDLFLAQGRCCALSGLSLTFPTKVRSGDGTASLDRIDSSKGYVPGNVQWVHKHINIMKRNHTDAYFIELCKAVAAAN